MHLFEGLILGLSTGVACIAFCGPILVPYLMAESHTIKQSAIDVSWFLAGRLVAYIITGLVAGFLGTLVFENEVFRKISGGWLYIFLSIAMVMYAFYRVNHLCLGESKGGLTSSLKVNWPHLLPVFGGFTSGINLCPPFILAITQASLTRSVVQSVLFFVAFFMGTSVYFIPMPFISVFRRKQNFQLIGKFAAAIVGAMYMYKGIMSIIK